MSQLFLLMVQSTHLTDTLLMVQSTHLTDTLLMVACIMEDISPVLMEPTGLSVLLQLLELMELPMVQSTHLMDTLPIACIMEDVPPGPIDTGLSVPLQLPELMELPMDLSGFLCSSQQWRMEARRLLIGQLFCMESRRKRCLRTPQAGSETELFSQERQ